MAIAIVMRAWPILVAAALTPHAAAAEETTRPSQYPVLLDRAHTVAEVEAGILVLPNAPISAAHRGGATPLGAVGNGDATVQTGIHVLYRANRVWAIGAGAIFAPNPTTDPNYYGGANQLPRTHSRSYLFLGGEARFYPLRFGSFAAWVGMTAGGLIIADRFATNTGPAVPSLLGTKIVTVSTEGAAVGVQLGTDYLITDRVVIGLAFRADRWFLPAQKPFSQESSCDALGDCPTLTGSVDAFEIGLKFGYQIPL
jgi:hypothetical protein